VVIRSSSSRNVERLITDLREGGSATRDAAVARLRLIGARADERLGAFIASDAPSEGRIAALRALEGRDEDSVRQVVVAACSDPDPGVATAAIGVLRGGLAQESGTAILDTLSGIALDLDREPDVRLAALDALSELPPDLVRPLLHGAPRPPDEAPVSGPSREAFDNPTGMIEWLSAHRDAPLSVLHEAITRARDKELEGPPTRIREAWTTARGTAHVALAQRGSRVALYDLRESFDSANAPLPSDFVSAMATIGDATCLEPLGRAWAASHGDSRWRDQLREAANDIVRRHRLTGRHGSLKRVRSKYHGFI
jgi:hypothetical protein